MVSDLICIVNFFWFNICHNFNICIIVNHKNTFDLWILNLIIWQSTYQTFSIFICTDYTIWDEDINEYKKRTKQMPLHLDHYTIWTSCVIPKSVLPKSCRLDANTEIALKVWICQHFKIRMLNHGKCIKIAENVKQLKL